MQPFGCLESCLYPAILQAPIALLKGSIMLRNSRKILSVCLIITLVISAFTFAFPLEVNAASGLPKVSSLKAGATQTSVSLSWKKLSKKQLKKVKGIAIYRNNTLIKYVSKKAGSFTDSGLKAETSYSYTVKTYKNTKKKEWFNKKTQKWQRKKPAKKYRGKSRKLKKYSGGITISVATRSAAPAVVPSEDPPSVDPPITESSDPEFLNSYLPASATYDLSAGSHTFTVNSKSGVTWSSSNMSVAKPATGISAAVNPGKINFISAGTATLTVTSKTSGDTKTIRLTITDNTSGGSPGEDPSTLKEFKVTEYPKTVDTKTESYTIKVQLPADNFGITWTSADEDCIQINGTDSKGVLYITAKKKYGNITLLGTLTVPEGVDYTGKTYVKVAITNSVYPCNADGSYTLTYNLKYWQCGGVMVRTDELFEILPSDTTFRVDINEINRLNPMGGVADIYL